jgi:hypothetical protein
MSDSTPRLGLPDLPDTPELYADTVADAFGRIDAFSDLYLKGQFVNTPPASPADGDAYLTGAAPTGGWSGYAYKIATCRDGGWVMLTPFNGLRGFVEGSNSFIVYCGGVWIDWNALISASESSVASAATCDLGAAGSLFLQVTGTTTITAFGAAANRLRLVRFAGALTLTHNAASLVLPGGANIVTAAGDTAIFASDGSGNWRCRCYSRADGRMVNMASPSFTGTLAAAALTFSTSLAPTVDAGMDVGDGSHRVRTLFASHMSDGATAGNMILSSSGTVLQHGVGTSWTAHNFYSGGTQAWAMAADGSFLVGTTANGGWSGDAKIAAVTATATAVSANATGASGNALLANVDQASGKLASFYYNHATNVGSITTTGSATAYNTSSDARLKTVRPQQASYRDAIRALWVGDFTWKDSGAPGFGVLAQQAFAVMPNHQGVTRPADAEEAWQASAEPFAHLALWGVKDLYALVEALGRRVAALEAAHDAG